MNPLSIRNALSVVAIGASLALPFAVRAQAPAPAAAPAAAPAPVSPEARAAIKDLLDVMNTRDNLSKTFQAMAQTLPPQMSQVMQRQLEANTALTPEQKVKVRDGMQQGPFEGAVKEAIGIVTAPKLVDETIDKMYGIYAKYYTTAEIRQLVAFYKSPVGAKTLSVMPQAINDSLQAGVQSFTPRINALMDRTMKTQMDLAAKK